MSQQVKKLETPYPLIDADPHASRVLRYMRPSDYGVIAASTAAAPGALYLWEHFDPSAKSAKLRGPLKLAALIGFTGGFLLAYQRSS
ncbi:hypothetical protein FRC02_001005, partial [Tulasnella sp. 418]